VLKQGQYQPLPVEKQVLILYAMTGGFADALPIETLSRYEQELYAFVDARHGELWDELRTKGTDGKSWDALQARMKAVLAEFGRQFAPDAQVAA
jgi:F-type H+-transporting ATPase subunit alpha